MARLALELITFLPALSADSSFLNGQRSSVMERGESPAAEQGQARAVRVKPAPVQGDRQDLPSETN